MIITSGRNFAHVARVRLPWHVQMCNLTHSGLGYFNEIIDEYFQANYSDWWLRYLLWNYPQKNVLTDDKSTLVHVMAWCRQATSHYLSQYWPCFCRHMASLGPNEFIIRVTGFPVHFKKVSDDSHAPLQKSVQCRYAYITWFIPVI